MRVSAESKDIDGHAFGNVVPEKLLYDKFLILKNSKLIQILQDTQKMSYDKLDSHIKNEGRRSVFATFRKCENEFQK